jgi:hypothetical protein
MIYAVLTREWPQSVKPSGTGNWIAIIFLFAFIPATNYFNGFSTERLVDLAEELNITNASQFAFLQLLIAGITIPVMTFLAVMIWKHYSSKEDKMVKIGLPAMLFITAIHYNLFAYIRLGTFYRPFSFTQSPTLYVFIVAIIFLLWHFGLRGTTDFPGKNSGDESWKRWGAIMMTLLIIIVVITLISINIHPEMPGAHDRF